MSLAAGTRLGHYEIRALVGQGGMGAVYAALDTRLGRTVAVKVITAPAADLRERFAREARIIATLQHPHICALYDVGSADGVDYLVMEHLEGSVPAGPLPLGQVIAHGIQIADALDAAHRKGITHRDLKPANILLTKSGVKVLDFGIARAAGLDTLTRTGQAIGTPAYMAPEQWAGGAADARSDVYALGRVLAEMATGEREPPAPVGPPGFDAIVQGCLAKDPDDRWQSARDVRRMLQDLQASLTAVRPTAPQSTVRWWIVALPVLILSGIVTAWRLMPDEARLPVLNLSLAPPRGSSFVVGRNFEGGIALSPDGKSIAFVASTGGHVQLWVRRLDEFDARPLPETNGAYYPFWSPDSRQVAFYTPDRLMRVVVDGGTVTMVCATDPRAAGGAWLADDVLLVTGRPGGGIHRIAAGGGESVRIAGGGWPQAIGDGRRFLYTDADGLRLGTIDRPANGRVIAHGPRARVVFADGHILFVRDRVLFAQALDPDAGELKGEPFAITSSLLASHVPGSQASFSATAGGVLAFAAGESLNRLRWRDRRGQLVGELGEPSQYVTPRISPDGRRVAYARLDGAGADIWISDLERGAVSRLTFEPVIDRFPIWSPDGRSITYASGSADESDLYRKLADGSGPAERLTFTPSRIHAMDWSADGTYLAFTQNNEGRGTDLLFLRDTAPYKPVVFLQTPVSEAHTQLAGVPTKWVAYSSDDRDGRREIYVAPFAEGQASGVRWQISVGGGTMPRWSRTGKEIVYWALDGRIMAAAVDGAAPAFRSSPPVALFQVQPPTLRTNDIEFDVTSDGERFLLIEPSEQTTFQSLSIVTGWLRR